MARTLTFNLNGIRLKSSPVKLERAKLYGRSELRAITPDGRICHHGGINSDGITLVEQGCVKQALITYDGLWADRSDLVAVKADGTAATLYESSFNEEIILSEKASPEDILNLKVLSVYQLGDAEAAELMNLIGSDIYRFSFSYTGGYELQTAFIIATDDSVYIITGTMCEFEFLSLSQTGTLDNDLMEMTDDDLDFSMM